MRFKMKSEQTSQRMLSALVGTQGNLLVQAVLTAWRKALDDLRQQNELERLRDENLSFKLKREEGARRMLSAMLGSQDSLLVKEVFAVWREVLDDLRQQNELQQLRQENLRFTLRSGENSKRMLSARRCIVMTSSSASSSSQSTLLLKILHDLPVNLPAMGFDARHAL